MYSAKIFLVGETESQLTEMVETPYDTEDILQLLLERYPDLLPGDQIDPENPRRWLLVSREMGVPGSEQGGNIWSLDHLFLDQDAMPTFVECKRASDTRARREVVAQMLDYAANGIQYWSIESLRQAALNTAIRRKKKLDEEILALLGPDGPADLEVFWKSVEKNLQSGHVRLIFVTDSVPRELRRLVEFLNGKMSDVDVLAVEVKQFLDKDKHKAIVPRVVGLTEAALDTKRPHPSRTNEGDFLEKCGPEAAELFRYMLKEANALGHTLYWGTSGFSIRYKLPNGQLDTFMLGYPPDLCQVYLSPPGFDEPAEKSIRKELTAGKLYKPGGKWTLSAYVSKTNVEQVKKSVEFVFQKVQEELDKKKMAEPK